MAPNDTRTALIEAAIKLFSSRGYEAVSTREIADAAAVNLGAIQYHFGNKANLFIEMVRSLMHTTGTAFRELQQLPPPKTELEAGSRLAQVVQAFLNENLDSAEPHGCKMMCREVLSGRQNDDGMLSQLIESVVSEFMRPFHQSMVEMIRVLAPSLSEEQLGLSAHSIAGQCAIYTSHGPFLQALHGDVLRTEESVKEIAEHVTVFSLRGLGCKPALIEKVCSGIREQNRK